MGLENYFPVDLVALLIASLSFWISLRTLSRTKANDIFALRQSVLLKAEMARSAWYKLRHEADSLIQQVNLHSTTDSPKKALLLDYLADHREHLNLCIRDAVAMAEDVHSNVDKFNEKKCRDYLRSIEPNLEILDRNQGVVGRRVSDLLNQLNTTST